MILSDRDIAKELGYGDLEINPVDLEEQLQPCSVDIRLGDEFARYDAPSGTVFDTKDTNAEEYLVSETVDEEGGIVIRPGSFWLANTVETVSIPDYLEAELMGRSSLARLGIEVHSTAGLFDAGFEGEGVLEISNNGVYPVRLYPNMRIAQFVFKCLESSAKKPYNSQDNKYQNQEGAVGSRIDQDHGT